MKKGCLLLLLLVFAACNENDSVGGIDLDGTWTAQVSVQSCAPADLCGSFGFQPGLTVTAIMELDQSGTDVSGTYTYQGLPINADIDGTLSGSNLVLNGNLNNPLGAATVEFTGTVSGDGDSINANVSHRITATDGRSATASGSGTFTRD